MGEVHRLSWAAMMQGVIPPRALEVAVQGDWASLWGAVLDRLGPRPQGAAVHGRPGGVAGLVWLGPGEGPDETAPHQAVLRRLYVAPDAQGAGVGAALLGWAEARALGAGARELLLWCLEANTGARAFYARHGYAPDGARAVNRRHGVELPKHRYRRALPGLGEAVGGAAVVLVPSDPGWPLAFAALAARLGAVLGSRALEVLHVGSTAVPGLPAKPILDVDVVIAEDLALAEVVGPLEAAGWRHRGDQGIPGRQVFRYQGAAPLPPHHL